MPDSLVSIIVPVYNSEKTLRRCLESILGQTYQHFELLLINDGSKDQSGEICDEYAQKDSRVKVIHKTNGGVSSARNVGLDNARGEWVTFVDSDDYLQIDYLYGFPITCNADLIIGSFIAINSMGDQETISCDVPTGVYARGTSFMQEYITNTRFKVPWCKLYRRSLLSHIRFNEKMIVGEDYQFNMSFLISFKKLIVLPNNKIDTVNYVYCIPDTPLHIKYQLSVPDAVFYTLQLNDSYERLGIISKEVETYIVESGYEFCKEDIKENGQLWYFNGDIKKLCMRRSRHLGFYFVVRSWLSFNIINRIRWCGLFKS